MPYDNDMVMINDAVARDFEQVAQRMPGAQISCAGIKKLIIWDPAVRLKDLDRCEEIEVLRPEMSYPHLVLDSAGVLCSLEKFPRLRSVEIPNNVQEINSESFKKNNLLTAITCNNRSMLQKIENDAFRGTALSSATFTKSCQSIGADFFTSNTLEIITVSPDLPGVFNAIAKTAQYCFFARVSSVPWFHYRFSEGQDEHLLAT
jgi:hypothetical protein